MVFKFLKTSYSNLKNALAKTSSLLGGKIRALFKGGVNEDTLEQLEQILYEADLGVQYAQELTQQIRQLLQKNPDMQSEALIAEIRKDLLNRLTPHLNEIKDIPSAEFPLVIMVVGVNGNGKTTSVAKLANYYKANNKNVLIAAADTFRAAAIEQLEIWAQRLQVEIVKGNPKSDPAAVVFDAITAGKARHSDVVIIDTAGRLHTKTPLMQELEKMKRSCSKIIPNAPHEILLVLDATTGQNAIEQAKIFHQFTPLTGLILTKLDGTAKGGIALAIQRQLKIPVKFIGIGENLEDLHPFDPKTFIDALFE